MSRPRNLDDLKRLDLTISGDPSVYMKNVSVTVDIQRSDAQYLKPGDLQVYVDLSGITGEGEKNVQVKCETPYGKVVKIVPDTIKITVEKLKSQVVPVQFIPTGDLPAGYWRGPETLSVSKLELKGAVSDVSRVAKAIVQVSMDNRTDNFNSACSFVLLDENGGTVSPGSMEMTPPNCTVSFDVLPTKEVPVDTNLSYKGSPAKGYAVAGPPQITPATVRIAAPRDVLDTITSVTLGRVDIGDATVTAPYTVEVELPDGVHAATSGSVTVTVPIDLKMVTRTMSGLPITIAHDPGVKPDQAYAGSVTFTCPELFADSLDESLMLLAADATGKGAGTYTLLVTAAYGDADMRVTVKNAPAVEVKLVAASP
jgi:YbbR domain-containing protein